MKIELSNFEVYGFCILDILTGDKSFSRKAVETIWRDSFS